MLFYVRHKVLCCTMFKATLLSFRWLFHLFFKSERFKVKISTYLVGFSIKKILRTFFHSPLVFKHLSCSENLIEMNLDHYKIVYWAAIKMVHNKQYPDWQS